MFILRLILTCSVLLLSTQAHAQIYGKTWTHDDIYNLQVQGFNLNMTQAEAEGILKRDHWEGEWGDYRTPEMAQPFSKGNSKLYLMRYPGEDRVMRLWSIVDRQALNRTNYDLPAMNRAIGDIWIDTVVGNYGDASVEFSNPDGINAYVYYLMEKYNTRMPKLEAYLNSFETSYELTDRTLLGPDYAGW